MPLSSPGRHDKVAHRRSAHCTTSLVEVRARPLLAKRSEAAICATTSPARQYPQNWARLDIAHQSSVTNFEGKRYFSNLEGAWPALGCWGRPDLADCQSTCLSLLFHGFFGSNPVLQAAAAIFLEECARDCPRRGAPH